MLVVILSLLNEALDHSPSGVHIGKEYFSCNLLSTSPVPVLWDVHFVKSHPQFSFETPSLARPSLGDNKPVKYTPKPLVISDFYPIFGIGRKSQFHQLARFRTCNIEKTRFLAS